MTKETLEFIHLKRAWYASSALKGAGYIDEVWVAITQDNMLLGEIAMRWYNLERNGRPAPQLEVFADGFRALRRMEMSAVIDELISLKDDEFTPKEFCVVLEECGFKDITPTTR